MKEERITRVTLEEARKLKGKTDWARLDREIAEGIEPEWDEDADGPEWDWENAVVVSGIEELMNLPLPKPKKAISLRVDTEILDFFKAQGKGYQTRMNAVLKAYMEAQKKQA